MNKKDTICHHHFIMLAVAGKEIKTTQIVKTFYCIFGVLEKLISYHI